MITIKREFKFNAYIPKLGIMLYGVGLDSGHTDGGYKVRIYSDDFKAAFKEKSKHFDIQSDWDTVISEVSVYEKGHKNSAEHFILDYIDLDYEYVIEISIKYCKVLQFTGMYDSNGVEIYEDDILELVREAPDSKNKKRLQYTETNRLTVHYMRYEFVYIMYADGKVAADSVNLLELTKLGISGKYRVVGNIHQDGYPLKEPNIIY